MQLQTQMQKARLPLLETPFLGLAMMASPPTPAFGLSEFRVWSGPRPSAIIVLYSLGRLSRCQMGRLPERNIKYLRIRFANLKPPG